MLSLTRRLGERVIIRVPNYPDIVVVYCGNGPYGGARLGFEAPADCKIYREELLTRKPEDEK